MSRGRVQVWFTMPTTYVQTLDLDALAEDGAPVDDVDALADWLEDTSTIGLDLLLENSREWSRDEGAVEVGDIEPVEDES